MTKYAVTIARGFGSGGKYIGEALGERLGIHCYEKELLTLASEASGINKALFAETDEHLRKSSILKRIMTIPRNTILSPQDKNFISDNNLFAIQSQIINDLADMESCIFIGKCADYVLKDRQNVLTVYIDAPRQACVESIMNKMSISEKEANRLISSTDKYRADYYKYYTQGIDWVNPTNYHLFLNSNKVGREQCIDILELIIKNKFGSDE